MSQQEAQEAQETERVLQFGEWAGEATKYHMMVKDIEELQDGESIEVLILDRNVLDVAASSKLNMPGVASRPEHFFRQNRHTLTKKEGNLGTLDLHYGGRHTDLKDIDIELLANNLWYPLQGGMRDGKHWSEYPPTSKVGWRGPMIRWTDLALMPKLMFRWQANGYSVM
eukprot:TRINITY_DN1992_c0_g2_i6.p1 TRINITY_DN1992_c0_g2~~TRINITY_DN1992_c0_g2_i6.p1  ORF type:complete len:169 (-),score=23.78 TRINITY_DN1992_c0_g2_i6:277-783(-)